ncbi:MAG: NAD(P)-binding protein [Microthrixaceae bacterium]|nr:NAD(P)-binding protein [Microthrixaceae bacterium]
MAVIGAGPCGLGCLRELDRLGMHDVVVLEAASGPGGLASSVTDEQGFTWDRGGHVVFSHHGEFDRLLTDVLGDEVLHHDRSSWVLADGSWVPYPFQNNLHRLEPDTALECLVGLIEAEGATAHADFESWIRATFGPGVARHFMIPYNEKVWATAPSTMGSGWIAERVSTTDWRKVLASALSGTDDLGWGPNNRFAFPRRGRHRRDLAQGRRALLRVDPLRQRRRVDRRDRR